MASSNRAAFMDSQGARLSIREREMPQPGRDEVLIRNHAWAVNPADHIIQDLGILVAQYPHILGLDVAGTVEAVGEDVSYVQKGDRVLALASHREKMSQPNYGGFQEYTVSPAEFVSKLPDNITFEQGVVLPLGLCTAAAGLYLSLELQLPSLKPAETGKTVFIWGGSTSVGACAIQLARGSGYKVITTASERNFDFCKSIGAWKVFDYKDSKVEDQIVDALNGEDFAGCMTTIGGDTVTDTCCNIVKRANGSKKITLIMPGAEANAPEGVDASSVQSVNIQHTPISTAVYHQFVPEALKNGTFLPKPDPKIVGKGLEDAQKAIDTLKAGVSATKIVIVK